MVKSVKGKIAAGVIVTGLVAGMGTAFASTDAGSQLTNWYNKTFNSASTAVQNEIVADYSAKLGQYSNEFNGVKNTAKNQVKTAGTAETNATKSTIETQADEHITAINDAAAGLDAAGDFTAFTNTKKAEVDGLKGQAQAYGTGQLNSAIGKQGNTTLGEVTTQLNNAKSAAVEELTAEIASVKGQIETAIAEAQATSDAEIRAHIEAQIADLRTTLQTLADTLVATEKAEIEAAGLAIETQALADLDALVAGINE